MHNSLTEFIQYGTLEQLRIGYCRIDVEQCFGKPAAWYGQPQIDHQSSPIWVYNNRLQVDFHDDRVESFSVRFGSRQILPVAFNIDIGDEISIDEFMKIACSLGVDPRADCE